MKITGSNDIELWERKSVKCSVAGLGLKDIAKCGENGSYLIFCKSYATRGPPGPVACKLRVPNLHRQSEKSSRIFSDKKMEPLIVNE